MVGVETDHMDDERLTVGGLDGSAGSPARTTGPRKFVRHFISLHLEVPERISCQRVDLGDPSFEALFFPIPCPRTVFVATTPVPAQVVRRLPSRLWSRDRQEHLLVRSLPVCVSNSAAVTSPTSVERPGRISGGTWIPARSDCFGGNYLVGHVLGDRVGRPD
jgi:hypothetical protein